MRIVRCHLRVILLITGLVLSMAAITGYVFAQAPVTGARVTFDSSSGASLTSRDITNPIQAQRLFITIHSLPHPSGTVPHYAQGVAFFGCLHGRSGPIHFTFTRGPSVVERDMIIPLCFVAIIGPQQDVRTVDYNALAALASNLNMNVSQFMY